MAAMAREVPSDPRALDLGWGEVGSTSLLCRMRVVQPMVELFLTCCSWSGTARDKADWKLAKVSVSLSDHVEGRQELLLRCVLEERAGQLSIPFARISGLRRLRSGSSPTPGLELRFSKHRLRLQLLAHAANKATPPEDELPEARFQLLHAFLAATAEEYHAALAEDPDESVRRAPRISPLEWPHEGGRRASLIQLAWALKRIQVVTASTIEEHAQFAGSGCAVCLDSWEAMPPDRSVTALNCGHAFCEQCLGKHLAQMQAQCPTCRAEMGTRRSSSIPSLPPTPPRTPPPEVEDEVEDTVTNEPVR